MYWGLKRWGKLELQLQVQPLAQYLLNKLRNTKKFISTSWRYEDSICGEEKKTRLWISNKSLAFEAEEHVLRNHIRNLAVTALKTDWFFQYLVCWLEKAKDRSIIPRTPNIAEINLFYLYEYLYDIICFVWFEKYDVRNIIKKMLRIISPITKLSHLSWFVAL